MQNKYFLLEYISFFLFIFNMTVIGTFIHFVRFLVSNSILLSSFNIVSLAFFVSVLCFNVLWVRYLKKVGYGQPKLPPNVFQLNCTNDQMLIEKFSIYFNTEWTEIQSSEIENSLYMLAARYGLYARVLLLRLKTFDNETFKRTKKISNKIINKQNKIDHYTSMTQSRKKVRVNFIIADEMNEYSAKLLEQNANFLFGRVEAVLNLFYFRDTKALCIPAHFGLVGFMKYRKVYLMIQKFAKGE